MDLQALRDFNLVAIHGGFGRAARATNRPKATLSRKVTELEQSLGLRLIERGTHSLRLTDEGLALHEATRGPLQDIAEAQLAVGSSASIPRGRLRVSAPIVLSHVALAAIGAEFARDYPEIELEIVAEDRKADPVEDGFDIVIRVNPSPDERLVGRRILKDELVLVGAAGTGLPDDDTIDAVALIAMPADATWRVATPDGPRLLRPRARVRFSSFLMVREGVLSGAGFALAPGLMVAGDIEAGRLMRLGVAEGPEVEIWALQNSRRLASSKVRLFLEALSRAFAA
jgi:DNA-binding transcriptional LysR family regulator